LNVPNKKQEFQPLKHYVWSESREYQDASLPDILLFITVAKGKKNHLVM
jgi:hypothetical protein